MICIILNKYNECVNITMFNIKLYKILCKLYLPYPPDLRMVRAGKGYSRLGRIATMPVNLEAVGEMSIE